MITQEEYMFILEVFSKIQISVLDERAPKVVELVHSIISKLKERQTDGI